MVPNPFQCLTLSLLVLPPLLLTTYFLAAFPSPPEPIRVSPSLNSLPKTHRSWEIYPEDFYDGGAYVQLPCGRVRYWIIGPESGQKVVLIHGLSIPSIIWQYVAPALAQRGFRVLLYDLYGRGYSDAPQTTYDVTLYTTQLALLMQHVKWDKAHIVGVSMGGAITAAFASHFPQLVSDKIVLVAPAGLIESSDLPRTAKFMSSPIVQSFTGSWPFRRYLQHLILSKTANSSSSNVFPGASASSISPQAVDLGATTPVPVQAHPSPGYDRIVATDTETGVSTFTVPLPTMSVSDKSSEGKQSPLSDAADLRIQEIVRIQSAHLPHYNAAVASSLRDGPIRGMERFFRDEIGMGGRKIMVIHGTHDRTVPFRYTPLLLSLLPESTRLNAMVVKVEGAGHELTVSEREKVRGDLSGVIAQWIAS